MIMDLKNYPHISEERKRKILDMSDAELMIEIESGNRSKMPRCIPYMRAVLAERNREILEDNDRAAQEHQNALLREAQLANSLSRDANRISRRAYLISALAFVVSVLSFLYIIAPWVLGNLQD